MGGSVGGGAGGARFEVRRASGPRRAMPQHAFFCGFTRQLLADEMRSVQLWAERAGFVVNADFVFNAGGLTGMCGHEGPDIERRRDGRYFKRHPNISL